MMIKKRKTIYSILALSLTVILLTSCSLENTDQVFIPTADFSQGDENPERLIAENDLFKLYIDETTTIVNVMDSSNGVRWYTSPPDAATDSVAKGENADKLFSSLSIEYTNIDDRLSFMNNYTHSIKDKQYKLEYDKDSVTVTYTLGKLTDRLLLPIVISEERMESDVLSKIEDESERSALLRVYRFYDLNKMTSEQQRETFLERYPNITEMNIYLLNPSLAKYMLERPADIIKSIGYTYEQIDEGYEEVGYVSEDTNTPVFVIPVRYSLTEYGLRLECLNSLIEYDNERFSLTNINLLEYFSAPKANEEGYMFYPEGSGGIINLNKSVSTGFPYRRPVFGSDLMNNTTTTRNPNTIMLPVFGMNDGEKGYIAVIESGEAIATIVADVQGRISEYNNIFPMFRRIANDTYTLDIQKGAEIRVYEPNPVDMDFSIHYMLLGNGHSTYSDMAYAYRKYMVEKGYLTKIEDDKLPLYLDLLGSITKKQTIFSIQFDKTVPLTTFSQAKDILNLLKNEGITNLNVKYSGWLNGGINRGLPSRASVESIIGGKKGLEDFNEFIMKDNNRLFLDVNFVMTGNTGLKDGFFASAHSLTTIDGKTSKIQDIDLALGIPTPNSSTYYPLNQKKQRNLASGFERSFHKLGIRSISLDDFSDKLYTNYKSRSHTNRQQAMYHRQDIAEIYSDYDILVTRATSYTLPFIGHTVEIPMPTFASREISREIPFMQMVIHGYVSYSTIPLNDIGLNRRQMILRAVETGSSPYYTLMYGDNSLLKNTDYSYLFSTNYEVWLSQIIEDYNYINSAIGHLQGYEIKEHVQLQQGLYKTVYGNGTIVYVNYNSEPVTVEGVTVKSNDYAVQH